MTSLLYKARDAYFKYYQEAVDYIGNTYLIERLYIEDDNDTIENEYTVEELLQKYLVNQEAKKINHR